MNDPTLMLRILQFADSAFPIGSFAFSDGLEAAVAEGLVRDAATLACYTDEIVRRTATTDAVAALHAASACRRKDYPAVCKAEAAWRAATASVVAVRRTISSV